MKAREEKGLSRPALAKITGTSGQMIEKLEKGERKFTQEWAERLAPALGKNPIELLEINPIRNDSTQPEIANNSLRTNSYIIEDTNLVSDVNLQKIQRLTGIMMPVYTSADAGKESMIIDPSPIDHVPRPVGLENEPEAFGVLITGDCMVPEYNPGEYAFVHPRKPPVRDKACLLMTDGQDGEWLASLKRFVRSTDKDWIVRTHEKPNKELHFSKAKWTKCLRIIGKWEGR